MSPMNSAKRNLLADAPVQLVLALLAGVFLSWPIIQIAGAGGAAVLFAYLFTVWAGLVLLLWRIGRAIAGARPADAEAADDAAAGGVK